ncbi:MAG: GldM family protein [Bacteroidota bacterium]
MKNVLLLSLLSLFFLQTNSQSAYKAKFVIPASYATDIMNNDGILALGDQQGEGAGKMSAAVFKAQDYCRAELKDFEFDARFIVVSADVYFSGANFRGVETGAITSSSFKPIKKLQERCTSGSFVFFDNIKVIGPDKKLRTIESVSYKLY